MWDKIVKGLAAAMGAVAGFLGGWGVMLTALAVAMGVDYITGLIVAWRGKSSKTDGGGLSSKAGFDGLARKGVVILIVLLATVLDRVLGGEVAIFQTAAAAYYIANEGLSILENAALMGVPFPPRMKKALEALKAKGETDAE